MRWMNETPIRRTFMWVKVWWSRVDCGVEPLDTIYLSFSSSLPWEEIYGLYLKQPFYHPSFYCFFNPWGHSLVFTQLLLFLAHCVLFTHSHFLILSLFLSKSGAVWWSSLVRGWDQRSWPAPRAAGKLLVCGSVFKPGLTRVSVAESKFVFYKAGEL